MHLTQVDSLVMHTQGPFVAVHFVAEIAEDACITAPRGRMHKLSEAISASSLALVPSLTQQLGVPLHMLPLTVHLLFLLSLLLIQVV